MWCCLCVAHIWQQWSRWDWMNNAHNSFMVMNDQKIHPHSWVHLVRTLFIWSLISWLYHSQWFLGPLSCLILCYSLFHSQYQRLISRIVANTVPWRSLLFTFTFGDVTLNTLTVWDLRIQWPSLPLVPNFSHCNFQGLLSLYYIGEVCYHLHM